MKTYQKIVSMTMAVCMLAGSIVSTAASAETADTIAPVQIPVIGQNIFYDAPMQVIAEKTADGAVLKFYNVQPEVKRLRHINADFFLEKEAVALGGVGVANGHIEVEQGDITINKVDLSSIDDYIMYTYKNSDSYYFETKSYYERLAMTEDYYEEVLPKALAKCETEEEKEAVLQEYNAEKEHDDESALQKYEEAVADAYEQRYHYWTDDDGSHPVGKDYNRWTEHLYLTTNGEAGNPDVLFSSSSETPLFTITVTDWEADGVVSEEEFENITFYDMSDAVVKNSIVVGSAIFVYVNGHFMTTEYNGLYFPPVSEISPYQGWSSMSAYPSWRTPGVEGFPIRRYELADVRTEDSLTLPVDVSVNGVLKEDAVDFTVTMYSDGTQGYVLRAAEDMNLKKGDKVMLGSLSSVSSYLQKPDSGFSFVGGTLTPVLDGGELLSLWTTDGDDIDITAAADGEDLCQFTKQKNCYLEASSDTQIAKGDKIVSFRLDTSQSKVSESFLHQTECSDYEQVFSAFGNTYLLHYDSHMINADETVYIQNLTDNASYQEISAVTAVKADAAQETTEETSEAADAVRGDANGDGRADIIDVISVNKAILGKDVLSEQAIKNVDYNKNGVPDATDSLNLMKFIVGLLAEF